MTATSSSHQKVQNPLATWPDKIKSQWTRWLMIVLVFGYVGFLIVTPLIALIFGALEKGIGTSLSSLNQPGIATSFWNTLWISLIVVIIHGVFGTITAWVFVRDRFPGRDLLNALVDMPFAISPVVAGYMLLLLFGRGGMLAPLIDFLGIQVAFALPGMVLATLFVTLPFMIRELIPVLESFDERQEKASFTLGATGW